MKNKTIIDLVDIRLLAYISENDKLKTKINFGDVHKVSGLTYANFLTHMKRLEKMIVVERKQYTKYVSLSQDGLNFYKSVSKILVDEE